MEKQSKVAIVCCSNGQHHKYKAKIETLKNTLLQIGLVPVFSDYIYQEFSVFSGSGKERAESLMDFYRDEEIKAIFDISGGDIANEILPYLDFDLIAQSNKSFWGYSDLTTIVNAIYSKTGKESVLYQIRNMIYKDADNQIKNFTNTIFNNTNDLFTFNYEFVQKDSMHGNVVGGNIRCLLKLAGTEYWPDMTGKVLLLESFSGVVPQMVTYLNQLKQIGTFDKITGIIFGTFTEMEEQACSPNIIDLVKQYVGDDIPIAITDEIGHGVNSKAIVIGKELYLNK
ncbi:S66 family peptidase [Anaeromicropila herbilytica]|uniref:LD-carboxypeptidase n=1 Tax=Anaeromicropila herbilytica TaxID=2785025 RepID=A0A7R7ICU4_9FIRM|nr:S66 peptidase family protein [Anaeromicropila herbilytica]BCN30892.1 LD-carboxypeptidase [Anaeromicropila herbilytica]